jgi:hypothetical protein
MDVTTAAEYVRLLEESGAVRPGEIQKLAESAIRIEVDQKALHPIESIKEMIGIKKPFHQRALQYLREGIHQAKPKAGLAALGIGAAVGVGALIKAYNEAKYQSALSDLKKDPEIQVDPERAKSIAKMVKRWAPSIAGDPEVLKGTVKNLMKFPDSYLTHDVARKLSETEKQYAGTHGLMALLTQRLV